MAHRPHADDPVILFQRGQRAAARVVPMLAVPDFTVQLVAARALLAVDAHLPAMIEAAKREEPERDAWLGDAPARAAMLERELHHDR